MSDLSINNLLSLLQNLPATQQQAVGTADSGTTTSADASSVAAGQDQSGAAANPAGGGTTSGASTPVVSADMTALLLQFQESQEMTDAQALLYGDGSGNGGNLVDYLDGNAGGDGQTPSNDAFMNLLASGANTNDLMSANQTLLDYLNGAGTDGTSTASSSDPASLDQIYSILGSTPPTATDSQSADTPPSEPIPPAPDPNFA